MMASNLRAMASNLLAKSQLVLLDVVPCCPVQTVVPIHSKGFTDNEMVGGLVS